jgi:hypothetical protein
MKQSHILWGFLTQAQDIWGLFSLLGWHFKWKSTTLASLINLQNKTRSHIPGSVTIHMLASKHKTPYGSVLKGWMAEKTDWICDLPVIPPGTGYQRSLLWQAISHLMFLHYMLQQIHPKKSTISLLKFWKQKKIRSRAADDVSPTMEKISIGVFSAIPHRRACHELVLNYDWVNEENSITEHILLLCLITLQNVYTH